ncbi:hypothetical protein EPH_0048820 [Eimeria praecox]|uniref:Integrase catalytic domain-containing protein n=1 Tax=Eimeria praecox TaxID=51316 RepID=U6GGU5_9EIME|nr:hypothetical protein EPH_0048820 [Eimeria praecox]
MEPRFADTARPLVELTRKGVSFAWGPSHTSAVRQLKRLLAEYTVSAAETVELLADRLIRYHGFPDVLISDRDPRFQSLVWEQLCHRFRIKRAMSSAYHPQSHGQTERVNRTLEQMLRTYIRSDEREWERLLPALELAYNTTSHSSTELSPFEVMIGQNPITAADLDVVGNLAPTLTPLMAKLFQQLCDCAGGHILRAKLQHSRTINVVVRQFLGTVNFCRMLMEPRFADTSRPLVELTRKGVSFAWVPSDTSAVRQLKRLLAEYTVSAAETVELLADRLIRYHGFPDVLISDRDPRFQSLVGTALSSVPY